MPTITAQQIVDRAGLILQDVTNVRWQESELLGWLNDGQRQVVELRPEAFAVNEALQLIAGTKQGIPATGIRLLDVVRNMGSDGSTPGRAIQIIDREVLDAQRPDWHSEVGDAEAKHYVYDGRDPRNFYVYPPQPVAPEYVEVVYSASPTDCLIGETIKLDDIYANALLDYILYRAYSKDAEYTQNVQRASQHYEVFLQSLGLKAQVDQTTNPHNNAPPFNPVVAERR